MAVASSPRTNSRRKEARASKKSRPSPEDPAPAVAQAPASTPPPTAKRTRNPGIRIIGGRIYDSEHGITCHQCRQKTRDFAAACKGMNRVNKPCTINFCHKCLLNRYGEKAEEVAKMEDWSCPKCRCVCNCSVCMKKKGHRPTGILVHTAKATGFSSVLDLLHHKGADVQNAVEDASSSPKSSAIPNKGSKRCRQEENCHGKQNPSEPMATDNKNKYKKKLSKKIKLEGNANREKKELSKKLKLEGNANREKKKLAKKLKLEGNVNKEKKKLAKKLKVKDNANKDTLDGSEAVVKQDNGSQGKVSNESLVNCSGEEVLLHGNKRIKSVVADSDNAQVRPPKVCKHKKQHLTNVKRGAESLSEIMPELNAVKKEGSLDGCGVTPMINTLIPNTKAKPSAEMFKTTKYESRRPIEPKRKSIVLPQGTPLMMVAGVELAEEDVGPALQFLEFCNAFAMVLGLNKGQAEAILRELLRSRAGRRVANSLVVDFHIKLLSVIQKDAGEDMSLSHSPTSGNSWLQALGKCINESQCAFEESFSDFSASSSFVYDSLDPSKKLRVLNVLCDETLSTKELRSWIDEENSRFVEKKKEIGEKVLAAKKREKDLKQKLKDDVAQTMLSWRGGASFSVLEHDNLISAIRTNTEKAHAEMLNSISALPKKTQIPDAVRTEPILLEGSGHTYWKLRSHCNRSNILLQDFENWDSNPSMDKWFICDNEDGKIIEKHISSIRLGGQLQHALGCC